MSAAPTSQISLRVEAIDAGPDGPEAIEEFAQQLRAALSDLGVRRVDQVAAEPAPEGTRALELLAVCGFVITLVQTGDALTRVVGAVRALVRRYAERGRRLRLTVDEDDVDLTKAGDEELERVVRVLLSRPGVPGTSVRSALVIANDRYDDARLAQLRAPSHDAAALSRVLGDPAIGGFDVELLENADERTLRRRIAAFFANRDRDDVLLLHFSCHGVKDVRGRLHLAARDTDLSVLGATAIPASFVNDLLADTQSRRVVLILDCCYSGAFARGTAVRSGSEVQIADEFGAGGGRIVLTASSATEYAFEGDELTRSEGQPSAFTDALVTGLETGAADLDTDGEITIDELYDYTYRTVRQTTPGQAPMKWSFGVEGNLVVARSVRPATLPAQILEDLSSDRPVLRLEAVRALTELLRTGRPGMQAAARSRLTQVRDDDDSSRVRQAAGDALGSAPSPVDEPPALPVAVPEPRRPVERPSPVDRPVPSSVEPPKPSPVDGRQRQRLTVPAVLVALLTIATVTSYLVATTWDQFPLSTTWYTDLIYVPELVGAVALLITRRPVWYGLIAGLLSWEGLWLGVFPQSPVREAEPAWRLLVLASLVAAIGQLIALVAAARSGTGRYWPATWSSVVAAAFGVAVFAGALLAAFLGGATLTLAFDLTPDNFDWARQLASVCCALAVPVGVLAVRSARTGSLLLAGWFAAALTSAGNDIVGGYASKSSIYWVIGLAALTTIVGYVAVYSLRKALASQRAQ